MLVEEVDMTKVVINVCYGGFGLSDKAYERLLELGMKKTRFTEKGGYEDPSAEIVDSHDDSLNKRAKKFSFGFRYSFTSYSGSDLEKMRTDPRVVQVVEEMGEEANGQCAELKIVEVPDDVDWHIDEYDGNEHIAENHRTWS
jgi:hypothetical protein